MDVDERAYPDDGMDLDAGMDLDERRVAGGDLDGDAEGDAEGDVERDAGKARADAGAATNLAVFLAQPAHRGAPPPLRRDASRHPARRARPLRHRRGMSGRRSAR